MINKLKQIMKEYEKELEIFGMAEIFVEYLSKVTKLQQMISEAQTTQGFMTLEEKLEMIATELEVIMLDGYVKGIKESDMEANGFVQIKGPDQNVIKSEFRAKVENARIVKVGQRNSDHNVLVKKEDVDDTKEIVDLLKFKSTKEQ